MRLLVTRPLEDARLQAGRLAALGHEAVLAPLLTVEPVPGIALPLEDAQALIVTSRNALRALAAHPARDRALALPLIAVGEATAREAERFGFKSVTVGEGIAESLLPLIAQRFAPSKGPLVHLAGETLAYDLKGALEARGFELRQPVLYRARAAEALPPEVVAELKAGKIDGVILMSPRTATIFAALMRKHGVTEAARLRCYCLSPSVAKAAAPLGAPLLVAARPREEDVLALLSSDAASSCGSSNLKGPGPNEVS
jgi:uroporphyrinogen-III synthase